MKLKTIVAVAAFASAHLVSAATLNFGNVDPSGGALFLFDNAGVPLGAGSTISLFAGTSPTTFEEAQALGPALEVITFFPGNNPDDGLIASAFDVGNTNGEITNLDLFALVSNPAGDQFGAIDLATVFLVDDSPIAPSSATENLTSGAVVTLGSTATTTLASPTIFQTDIPGTGLFLAAVPEPSAALLAGLALVGGLVRRRR